MVAAGNDLDRQAFTGIVKELGFNSLFLSRTFGFCPYRLSRCTILARAVPPPLSPYPYLSRAPLSIKMYSITNELDRPALPVNPTLSLSLRAG